MNLPLDQILHGDCIEKLSLQLREEIAFQKIDVIVLNTLETEDAPISPDLLRAEP